MGFTGSTRQSLRNPQRKTCGKQSRGNEWGMAQYGIVRINKITRHDTEKLATAAAEQYLPSTQGEGSYLVVKVLKVVSMVHTTLVEDFTNES